MFVVTSYMETGESLVCITSLLLLRFVWKLFAVNVKRPEVAEAAIV